MLIVELVTIEESVCAAAVSPAIEGRLRTVERSGRVESEGKGEGDGGVGSKMFVGCEELGRRQSKLACGACSWCWGGSGCVKWIVKERVWKGEGRFF
jgi:hypothetical protein